MACKCNSLQSCYPHVAADWDHAKNPGQPADYPASSTHIAWWCTAERGSWQQSHQWPNSCCAAGTRSSQTPAAATVCSTARVVVALASSTHFCRDIARGELQVALSVSKVWYAAASYGCMLCNTSLTLCPGDSCRHFLKCLSAACCTISRSYHAGLSVLRASNQHSITQYIQMHVLEAYV